MPTVLRSFWLMLAWTLTVGCASSLGPPSPASCDNPAAATDSLLIWQHAKYFDMASATKCVEKVPGADTRQLASQLKQVLDARGLYVPVSSMSTDPAYLNEEEVAEVRPFGQSFPLVIRRGDDGQWRYARETMEQVPRLYAETFSPAAQALLARMPPVFSRSFLGIQLWQLVFGVLLFVHTVAGSTKE